MDPLCHTLVGAALGEAGLRRRTALGMTTLVLAANVPDIDIAVFATGTLQMSFRRGWTHGVLAMAVLPILLTGLMLAWDHWVRQRRISPPTRADAKALLWLSCLGMWTHPLLDFLNSYGVRLLKPLSDRWFYGDALYIVDPWLYLLLGGAVLAARVGARADRGRPWAARAGLVAATAYVAVMLVSNLWARQVVASGLTRAGLSESRFMVTPVFLNPFRREVIVDAGDRYERGFVWFEPTPHFRPAGFGVGKGLDEPAANAAMLTPLAQQFLGWSRFPFFVVDRTATSHRVLLSDYRYADATGRGGWASVVIDLPPARRNEEP